MRFVVGGNGWQQKVGNNYIYRQPGTVIDDGLTQLNRQSVIPPDALALDQVTYNYMTSNGMVGLGYDYTVVRAIAGVVTIKPPYGETFIPGSGQTLGGGSVLG